MSARLGPFRAFSASYTCLLAKYLIVTEIAFWRDIDLSTIEEAGLSVESASWGIAPKTRSVGPSLSGPVQSLSDFTAICGAASSSKS